MCALPFYYGTGTWGPGTVRPVIISLLCDTSMHPPEGQSPFLMLDVPSIDIHTNVSLLLASIFGVSEIVVRWKWKIHIHIYRRLFSLNIIHVYLMSGHLFSPFIHSFILVRDAEGNSNLRLRHKSNIINDISQITKQKLPLHVYNGFPSIHGEAETENPSINANKLQKLIKWNIWRKKQTKKRSRTRD